MQCESGGDSQAENGWDINAINGTPSIGCAQVIQPTFDANAASGCSDIRDPTCNLMAALNYMVGRYGGIPSWFQAGSCGGYSIGGVVPGMTGAAVPSIVHAGERVLTPTQNRAFEDLVYGNGGGTRNEAGGGDTYNDLHVEINVDGTGHSSEELAAKIKDELVGLQRTLSEGGGHVRSRVSAGFS